MIRVILVGGIKIFSLFVFFSPKSNIFRKDAILLFFKKILFNLFVIIF